MISQRPREIEHVNRLRVTLALEGRDREVGTLVWSVRDRAAYFDYAQQFLADPLPISPFNLPVRSGLMKGTPVFEGLHGAFADSVPDGWGRKLLDRRLSAAGYDELSVMPIDRLAFVGQRGMGALCYRPEMPRDDAADSNADLDWLSDEARKVETDEPEIDISKLAAAQGGSGGARPKIVVGYAPKRGSLVLDRGQTLPPGFEHWLVKFRSVNDPREIGVEEYAYALMAKAAGVIMPEVQLLRTENDAYFAVKRFDRSSSGRHHIHTAAALVNANYRFPGALDYRDLMAITWELTKNEKHVRQMFLRMVFNVLAHDRDDHAKNHAYLMNAGGDWSPTPAYDITYSAGPAGEHNLAVAGEGRNPDLPHILTVANDAGIAEAAAREIFEHVRMVVQGWRSYADQAGLSPRRAVAIDRALNGRRLAPRRNRRTQAAPNDAPRSP
jgi:serine/threonine-protein kinase HipA